MQLFWTIVVAVVTLFIVPYLVSIQANANTPWFLAKFEGFKKSRAERRKERSASVKEIGTYLAENQTAAIAFHLSYRAEFRRQLWLIALCVFIFICGTAYGLYNAYVRLPNMPTPVLIDGWTALLIFPGAIFAPLYIWLILIFFRLVRLRRNYRDILDFVRLTLPLEFPLRPYDLYELTGFVRWREFTKDMTVEERLEHIRSGKEDGPRVVLGEEWNVRPEVMRHLDELDEDGPPKAETRRKESSE